jgi:O-antigen/teichoic acid export membrane protein
MAVSSGAAARALSGGVALLSLPLAVRYLGAERFGVWAAVSSTVVFLNLLDFGIASTLTNHIALAYATGDRESAARSVSNALALSVACAATAGLLLAGLWNRFDFVGLLNVPASVPPSEVNATVGLSVTLVLLGIPASLAGRILAGYQEVHRGNVIIAVATVGNFVGLVAGIATHASMPVLFALAVGWTTILNLVALGGIVLWFKPWLKPRISLFQWACARGLLGSGAGFFLIQIAGAVVYSSDNVVLSHYLGAAQVTPYNVTWKLVGFATVAQGLLFPALWPAYAEAHVSGDYAWMRRMFKTTIRATLACNVAFAGVLVVAGQGLIRWWAGPSAVPSRGLLAAMGLWAAISGCMTTESCLLAAVNRTREQGVPSIVAAAVNLALSIFLVQRVGAVGVIGGTILSYLLVLVGPQTLLVRDVLRDSSPRPRATAVGQNTVAT